MAIKANEFDLAEQVIRLCSPKSAGTIVNARRDVPSLAVADAGKADLKEADSLFNQKQYEQAYTLYEKLSATGNADAANQIGLMLQSGMGVDKNERKAFEYYDLAAKRGSVFGNYNVGVFKLKGIGITRDYSEAIERFTFSADHGHAESQNYLGVMYANGYGLKKDLQEALKWYKLAASNGSGFAKQNISSLIDIGAATEADLVIPSSGNHLPDWKRPPTTEQIATFYPKIAALNRVTGKVIVRCELDEKGEVGACNVLSENPAGFDFGNAALKLAKISEFTPQILNGKPVKGYVNVPFNFTLPKSVLERLIKTLGASN
ncbi:MAG: TonB family protein [Alphaproteobacteria bacterium]